MRSQSQEGSAFVQVLELVSSHTWTHVCWTANQCSSTQGGPPRAPRAAFVEGGDSSTASCSMGTKDSCRTAGMERLLSPGRWESCPSFKNCKRLQVQPQRRKTEVALAGWLGIGSLENSECFTFQENHRFSKQNP